LRRMYRPRHSPAAQCGWRRKLWWRKRRLRRIKTIRHVIGGIQPRINGRNAEQFLAEFHQADVGVLRPRNISLPRIWTDDETRNAGTVAELLAVKFRMRVPRILGSTAVPFFNIGRNDMVVPSAPVIPGHKNDG